MKVLITGGLGFVGKNLRLWLSERGFSKIDILSREDNALTISKKICDADFIFHLAGENRPKSQSKFKEVNVDFTRDILDILIQNKLSTPIVFAKVKKGK